MTLCTWEGVDTSSQLALTILSLASKTRGSEPGRILSPYLFLDLEQVAEEPFAPVARISLAGSERLPPLPSPDFSERADSCCGPYGPLGWPWLCWPTAIFPSTVGAAAHALVGFLPGLGLVNGWCPQD